MAPTEDGDGELPALKGLLESEGWRIYCQHLDALWGADAALAAIGRAVSVVPMGDQLAVNDATQHVLSAQKHIMALKRWPAERIRELSTSHTSRRPFAALRRAGG
jgi:hypothetical protein